MISNEERTIALEMINRFLNHNFIDALTFFKRQYKNTETIYYSLGLRDWCNDNSVFLHEMKADVFSGQTKAVIVSDLLKSWVVKVSFIRATDPDYVRNGTGDIDFCALEANNYELACQDDLGGCFAETYFLTRLDGINFYVQEKLEVNEDEVFSMFEEYAAEDYEPWRDGESEDERSDNICSLAEDLGDEQRLAAIFGWQCGGRLYDFVIDYIEREVAGHILSGDLHSGNYGFDEQGKAKIMDFSGYLC